jgi:hypothetical protein
MSSTHRVVRSSHGTMTMETSAKKGSDQRDRGAKPSRGVRTKYQIELDSDDITSPLHFTPPPPPPPRADRSQRKERSRYRPSGVATKMTPEYPTAASKSTGSPFIGRPSSPRNTATPTKKIERPVSGERRRRSSRGEDPNLRTTTLVAEEKSRYSLRSLRKAEPPQDPETLPMGSRPQRWSVDRKPTAATPLPRAPSSGTGAADSGSASGVERKQRPVSMRNVNIASSLDNLRK